MSLNYSLTNHPRGYSLAWYEFIPGLIISPYAFRHLRLADSTDTPRQHTLGHRLICALQFIPVIGVLAGLIERIVVAVHYAIFGSPKKARRVSFKTPHSSPLTPSSFETKKKAKDLLVRLSLSRKSILAQMTPVTLRKINIDAANREMYHNFQKAISEKRKLLGENHENVVATLIKSAVERTVDRNLSFEIHEHCMQGRRGEMEDAHFNITIPQGKLFGIFDGHGDSGKVAEYASEYFQKNFSENLKNAAHVKEAFEITFRKVQEEIEQKIKDKEFDGGCTALVTFIDKATHGAYTATLGDSVVNIYRRGKKEVKCIPLSCVRDWNSPNDEKRALEWYDEQIKSMPPSESGFNFEKFKKQFLATKGKERRFPGWPFPSINVSRSLGDIYLDTVSHEPKITMHYVKPGDLLVFGCDGLWDFIDEEEVMNKIIEPYMAAPDGNIAETLAKHSYKVGKYQNGKKIKSTDNISVMTVLVN